MRESEIEKALTTGVKALGGEVRKVRWLDRRGAPDRLVLLPGRDIQTSHNVVYAPAGVFFVELKATGKKPTKVQTREHARLMRYGLRVEVVDSLERVVEVLS